VTQTLTDYLLINGTRYRVALSGAIGQFRPSQLPILPGQVTGKRNQSPFIDAEIVGFEVRRGGADDGR